MNWLDFVIIAVVAVVAMAGWRMGVIHVAVTGAGILAGIVLASRARDRVEPLFSPIIDSDDGAQVAAFIAIFAVVLVASLFVGFMVHGLMKRFMLGWIDRFVGLALGVVVTLAVGSAALSTIQSHPVLDLVDTIDASTLGSFLADNFDAVLRALRFIPGDLGN